VVIVISQYFNTLGVFVDGPRCHPQAPLLANPNLFRNPNMVFESTYCTATTKSLFPMAPGLQIPRSTETESLIDSLQYTSKITASASATMAGHYYYTNAWARFFFRLDAFLSPNNGVEAL